MQAACSSGCKTLASGNEVLALYPSIVTIYIYCVCVCVSHKSGRVEQDDSTPVVARDIIHRQMTLLICAE